MKGTTLGAVLALAGLAAAAAAQHDHAAAPKEPDTTVQGEVLDMACYMGHEGKGAKHSQCAKGCISAGAPMGLLQADGSVLLLVNDHHQERAFADAKALGGEKAKITGRIAKRGGVTALIVEKAEKGG